MTEKLLKLLVKLRLVSYRPVHYIGGNDVLPPPLKGAQEQAALEALEQGDEDAKQLLIERNLRLVVFIARRFENTGINLEDLISIGTIGLIKAVDTYRLDRNIKLATYASRCVENEILMHIRKISNQKTEVSLDEPINMDYDGNELLLSDILGTDEDMILRPMEDAVDLLLLRQAGTVCFNIVNSILEELKSSFGSHYVAVSGRSLSCTCVTRRSLSCTCVA